MKLLFVIPEYPPDHGGGIATGYGALLPELVRLGHEVDVIVGSAFVSGNHSYEREGVHVRLLEEGRTEGLLSGYDRYAPMPDVQRYLAAARAMWEQAGGGEGYDAVQVADWGLLFAPWVAEEGPPTIVQLHGSSGQISTYDAYPGTELAGTFMRVLEAGLLAYADGLHTYSTLNARDWETRTGREVVVTPCPAPRVEQVKRVARSKKGFVAARIQEWKGPQVLCEALRQLGEKAPIVEWAGRVVPHPETGAPYDQVLADYYSEVWGTKLRVLGRILPSEVARKQAEAAFALVPSLWDVYNHTVIEAMQQEAVVICSDGAGASELITPGVNGFLFSRGNAGALAESILQAGDLDEAGRQAMGSEARRTTLERLDPKRIAALREEHYRTLKKHSGGVADWLREAVLPIKSSWPLTFLDQLPLRSLSTYVGRRAWARVKHTLRRS